MIDYEHVRIKFSEILNGKLQDNPAEKGRLESAFYWTAKYIYDKGHEDGKKGTVMDIVTDVQKFMQACDQVPSDTMQVLYTKLIVEEFNEFCAAENAEKKIDAVADLIWVLIGYAISAKSDFTCAWKEVRDSNMQKIDANTGKVVRREDGKILKPNGWEPPNFKECINED